MHCTVVCGKALLQTHTTVQVQIQIHKYISTLWSSEVLIYNTYIDLRIYTQCACTCFVYYGQPKSVYRTISFWIEMKKAGHEDQLLFMIKCISCFVQSNGHAYFTFCFVDVYFYRLPFIVRSTLLPTNLAIKHKSKVNISKEYYYHYAATNTNAH